MGLGTKNSLADSDADTSIVKNDGIGNAETTAHKFRKLWHWQGPRVERHAAFSWKPHVTLIFRGSISDQSSNLPSEKLEQHWPGSLRNANHIYEIPGTLVPGLVEQNYKRHRQRQDFTNYKRHCQQQDFSMAAINLHGFLDQSCVRISFDPSQLWCLISGANGRVVLADELVVGICTMATGSSRQPGWDPPSKWG
ncbi:hypothetical protein BJ322DRAFT_1018316 [Thelephora terrestris]|uniref:Uncharacterized protein n=1 Tax=Thelephora terrestris TaxID=56493 RepID=A0A9P6HP89_9AGAM|nr:hypothetical protein BJ322DRAFT_1018316 [Thelephora terrestris]